MHVKSELIKKSLLAEMYDITVRWRHSQWQFGPGFEITVLLLFFFLYSIPNCWLWDSLLWPGVHFSWRAPPNLSATDLVRITPVSGVGFQSWSLSGKLALGSTVDECVHKFTLKASVPYYSAPAHNHFLLLRRAE